MWVDDIGGGWSLANKPKAAMRGRQSHMIMDSDICRRIAMKRELYVDIVILERTPHR
jgi:hypothetical protein